MCLLFVKRGTFDHARRLTAPFVLPPRPPPRELQRMAAREAAAAKASELDAVATPKPTGELNADAARLETMDMLRQLQREAAGTAGAEEAEQHAGTAGAEEAEQREVTVRRRQQEYTVTQQQGFTSAKVW